MQPPFLSGNYQKRLLKTTEAHLSNGTCDLTIGTQEKKNHHALPRFSWPFRWCDPFCSKRYSSRNHLLNSSNCSRANQKPTNDGKQQTLCIGFLLTDHQFKRLGQCRRQIFGLLLPKFYKHFKKYNSSCDNLHPSGNT